MLAAKVLRNVFCGFGFRARRTIGLPIYPTFLVYKTTLNCNSRCKMCSIWQTKKTNELTLAELEKIFENPLWKNLKYVLLTGGEPFLRQDLTGIVSTLQQRMPKLKIIAVATNGLLEDIVVKGVSTILNKLNKSILLSVVVSIDGPPEVHDKIRGIAGAYNRAMSTFGQLKELESQYENFTVGIETVVSKYNVDKLDAIYEEFSKLTPHINFTPAILAPYFDNASLDFSISASDYPKLVDFYRRIGRENPQLAYYYENIMRFLKDGKRHYPCLGGTRTICLDSGGNILPCTMLDQSFGNAKTESGENIWFGERAKTFRKNMKNLQFCKTCLNSCDMVNNYNEEFLDVLFFLLKRPGISYNLLHKMDPYAKKFMR